MLICSEKNMHNAKAVFIISLTDKTFSNCCYYCGSSMVGVRLSQTNNHHVPKFKQFFNKYKNFNGFTFRVGYTKAERFFYRNKNDTHFLGLEANILYTSSKILNFKYVLLEYIGNASKGAPHMMIDEIKSGNLDWATGGISQTLARTVIKGVEFLRYLKFQKYMFVYQIYEDQWVLIKDMMYTLYLSNHRTFLFLALTVIAIALLIKFSMKFSRKFSYNFGEYVTMVCFYVIEQPSWRLNSHRQQWRPYISFIFVLWLFITIPVFVSYKSVQTYFLMTSHMITLTTNDLSEKGFKLETNIDDFSNINKHCSMSNTKLCTKVQKILIPIPTNNFCESIYRVLEGKVAFVAEEDPLKFLTLQQCNLTAPQKYNLKFAPADLFATEWHAWPFQKLAALTRTFSILISRMEASGLLQYWHAKNAKDYNTISIKSQLSNEKKPLNLSSLINPLMFLITGCFIASVVFIKEICSNGNIKRNR